MIPIDANTYFCLKDLKKNNVVLIVDTILLLNVENVDFFQGKIVERESHEMISLTPESKVWVVNNSVHFVRSDKICIKGAPFTRKTSPYSTDFGGRREHAA